MYFKTKKTTETGKKFVAFQEELDRAHIAIKEVLGEFNAYQYTTIPFMLDTGISSVLFDETPDFKYWKICDKGYYPKKNTKKGREMAAKLSNTPLVSEDMLNACIGYKADGSYHIGYHERDDNYYFHHNMLEGWECPEDCEEIIYSEYKKAIT